MTEQSYKVERLKLIIKERKAKVRDAKHSMEYGYIKLKADFDREYDRLKSEYERECITLEREKIILEEAIENAERGFSS